ncbi:MAG TPA: hypothetical protein VF576_09920 [Rubricoccaceae bacterium]
MFTFSTSTDTRGPKQLIQRVYTLAQQEARDARARRGLPFGGLFGTAESAGTDSVLPLVAAASEQTSAGNAASV